MEDLRRMVWYHTGRDAEAFEEVLQEVLIALVGALPAWREEGSFSTYLYGLVRFKSGEARRRQKRRQDRRHPGLDEGWELQLVDQRNPAPDSELIREAEQAELRAALAKLEELDRQVVLLRLVEGLDEAQTAQVLKLSRLAVRSRLHRSRQRLKQWLATDGQGGKT
jgi:RNA polymerase sigma-70 factor (ECF subfamily)